MRVIVRLAGASVIAAAIAVPLLVGGSGAHAQGCKGLGQETAGVAQANTGVGFFSELAKSAPGAAANQVHTEMGFLCD